jgi:hypothetical protein
VIEKPHKKTEMYSSIDTKVDGRKPSPYKTAGELFIPPNLHVLTLIGKQTYIYSHLTKTSIRVSRCRFGAKIIFPTKPTSTHTYWKKAIGVSRCRFGGINISPANFTSTCFYSDFHAKQVDVHLAGKYYTTVSNLIDFVPFPKILGNYVVSCGG